MAVPFKIYNTRTRKLEDFEPIEAGKIRLYACGNTVYDHCHIGHARGMILFDSFVRYLRHRGWDIDFVRNFTDVDDKIICRANELGEDPLALSARFIGEYRADAAAMGLDTPNKEPKVSDSMEDILGMIGSLIDKGHAYQNEGSVWFDVGSYSDYGSLSGQKVDELRSADEVAGKRSPADFALWKAVKPGEPSWPSPWGDGRPGWHIECSAMAKATLGDTVDIHGGGLDLVFPHHENEVAQSVCGNKADYARVWMHHGLLTMASGQKMGKSFGNVINVKVALEQFPAETLRLYYLQNQYRSPLPWGDEALPEALAMLSRLYEAREVAEAMGGEEPAANVAKSMGADALKLLELGESFPERFYAAMDQDFNTALAIAHLMELSRAINRFGNLKKANKRGGPVVAPALKAFALVTETIGLMRMTSAEFHADVKGKRLAAMGIEAAKIEKLIEDRGTARAEKNWARADEIREDLEAKSILVMDLADGVQWRVKL
ncbi:MAG: cysteine--tRNA ligase [Myxococcales bacterium]|nr:cysteine--tRNA ligase [Myxococcales bacterium]